MKTTEIAVEFKNVTKAFGDVQAVQNLNFSIDHGKLVTLLGPSGCGKTTTLRLIAGLEMVSAGSIFIDGKEVTRLSASDRDVSMVFQSYALFPHMTVMQNVSYGLAMSQMPKLEAREKAMEGLELVGLAGFGERLPSELSGGQQQRLVIARALALKPDILLLDEPTSALDPLTTLFIEELMASLKKRCTIVIVTHNMQQAARVSDYTAFFHQGRLIEYADSDTLFTMPEKKQTEEISF